VLKVILNHVTTWFSSLHPFIACDKNYSVKRALDRTVASLLIFLQFSDASNSKKNRERIVLARQHRMACFSSSLYEILSLLGVLGKGSQPDRGILLHL
jgi:hypothetical protein